MRGQLSLELLLVMLTAIVMLSFLVPQIQKVKDLSDYALTSRNAQLILDQLYYSCERAQISGEGQSLIINAVSNYSLRSTGDSLVIKFGNKSLSRQGFGCDVSQNVSKGRNSLTLSPGP
jgi:uncharacterized protein (UPF0333 family)